MRDIVPMQNLGTDHYDTRKLKLSLAFAQFSQKKFVQSGAMGGKLPKWEKVWFAALVSWNFPYL